MFGESNEGHVFNDIIMITMFFLHRFPFDIYLRIGYKSHRHILGNLFYARCILFLHRLSNSLLYSSTYHSACFVLDFRYILVGFFLLFMVCVQNW